MIWKMSDVFFVMIAISLSMNLLIILLVLLRHFLENQFNMQQISRLFKFVMMYMLIPLPAISCYVLYVLSFHKSYTIMSDHFSQIHIIGNRTIGVSTGFGNHMIFMILMIIWFIGFVCFGIRRYINSRCILRKLEKHSSMSQNLQLLAIKEVLTQNLRINRPVTLLTNTLIPVPFLLGLFHIKIFIPQLELSESELKLIIEHELAHCKGNDYFYRKLIFLFCSIYWFNPFVYILANYFVHINEMACDEVVLYGKSNKERCTYATLIINMAEGKVLIQGAVSLTGHSGNDLGTRIKHVMKKAKKSKGISFLLLIAFVALSCPLSVAVASNGTSIVQNMISTRIEKRYSSVEQAEKCDTHIEYIEVADDKTVTMKAVVVTERGVTWIDYDINIKGTERILINTVDLASSDKVVFYLKGDNSDDKFEAGIIDADKKIRYVISSDGKINHTFCISKNEEYQLFIEGTTSNDIRVSGSIIIIN